MGRYFQGAEAYEQYIAGLEVKDLSSGLGACTHLPRLLPELLAVMAALYRSTAQELAASAAREREKGPSGLARQILA